MKKRKSTFMVNLNANFVVVSTRGLLTAEESAGIRRYSPEELELGVGKKWLLQA